MKIEDFRNLAYVDLFDIVDLKKVIGGWIQWDDMQMLFECQANQMKIDNFWNKDIRDFKKLLTFGLR